MYIPPSMQRRLKKERERRKAHLVETLLYIMTPNENTVVPFLDKPTTLFPSDHPFSNGDLLLQISTTIVPVMSLVYTSKYFYNVLHMYRAIYVRLKEVWRMKSYDDKLLFPKMVIDFLTEQNFFQVKEKIVASLRSTDGIGLREDEEDLILDQKVPNLASLQNYIEKFVPYLDLSQFPQIHMIKYYQLLCYKLFFPVDTNIMSIELKSKISYNRYEYTFEVLCWTKEKKKNDQNTYRTILFQILAPDYLSGGFDSIAILEPLQNSPNVIYTEETSFTYSWIRRFHTGDRKEVSQISWNLLRDGENNLTEGMTKSGMINSVITSFPPQSLISLCARLSYYCTDTENSSDLSYKHRNNNRPFWPFHFLSGGTIESESQVKSKNIHSSGLKDRVVTERRRHS